MIIYHYIMTSVHHGCVRRLVFPLQPAQIIHLLNPLMGEINGRLHLTVLTSCPILVDFAPVLRAIFGPFNVTVLSFILW